MVLFNYSTRELTAKVVYYGPGLCGKTTNLQFIHENLPENVRGKMLSLATKTDRTLFFDFLPIDLGEIRGMKTRVQLYTVPGQVFYNETRKLVLKGADGIVFVADSQETMLGANVESYKNLEENLRAHGMRLPDMPHVIQFNKRDLPRLSPIEDLNAAINKYNAPFYESVAVTGIGVQDTLKAIVKLVLLHLTRKYDPKAAAATPSASVAVPATPITPAPPSPAVAVPISRVEVPVVAPVARAVPPPPDFRVPAVAATAVEEEPALGRFDESEIDGIMAEVGEVELEEPASPAAEDEGVWLGTPEDETSPFAGADSAFGATLSIDELADKVESRPSPPEPPRFRGVPDDRYEIDRGFDPEWSMPPAPIPVPEESAPAPEVGARFEAPPVDEDPIPIPLALPEEDRADDAVVLTEVAATSDLFDDPGLEIAQIAAGEAREIVVPVQLGEGRTARRFALSIRLRLDPVEPQE